MNKLLILLVFPVLLGLGYMVWVGLATLLQWLVNMAFGSTYDLNVWAIGGILMIVALIINGLKG